MNSIIKLLFLILRIIRIILSLPLLVLVKIGSFYAKLLNIVDKRNHSAEWQEFLSESINSFKSKKIQISKNPNKFIQFYHPSKISAYRSKTIFTKEPDTIEWLNRNGGTNKILFDIGANLGLYSVYYAKKFNGKVYSFEPSFKNLELFTRNIKLNSLQKNIFIIPNTVSKNSEIKRFLQNDFTAGQAQATSQSILENNNNFYKENQNSIDYQVISFSLNNLISNKLVENPDLIKIDVDGNELEILEGFESLRNIKNISLIIETRKETEEEVYQKLVMLGFKKISRRKDNTVWKK